MRKLVTLAASFIFIITTVLYLFFFTPTSVQACLCAMGDSVTPEELLDMHDAVFIGKVVDERKATDWGRVFKFQVSSGWKGVDQAEISIRTGNGNGDCGYDFQVGQEYLVYATRLEANLDGSDLNTNICTATRHVVNNGTKYVYEKFENDVITEDDVEMLKPAKVQAKIFQQPSESGKDARSEPPYLPYLPYVTLAFVLTVAVLVVVKAKKQRS